ncbi:MAG TPA: GNAT family N-acetyltransferase [Gemmataceae bacterium]|nr:GNAT family N-acetyltransferase [Gemmataceae bacterium]
MEYRGATAADAPALAAMNRELIRDEGHRNPMTITELTDRMAGWLAGEYEAVVFEEGGRPAGYALYRRSPEYVYLRQFFVRPECRRRGVGRAAVAWLWRHAWGGGRVRVEVLAGNLAGVAFWRAVGFRDYGLTLELEGGHTEQG